MPEQELPAVPAAGGGRAGRCDDRARDAPDSVPAGTHALVTVSVVGVEVAPTFHWTVKGGTIASGQGTPNVLVDTTGFAGATIFASVELGGLPHECATKAAGASFLVGPVVTTTSR